MSRAIFVLLIFLSSNLNADWPQFLGPDRNGIADSETTIRILSDTEEYPTLWKIKVGDGHSSPVVSNGKVVLHHRIGATEVLQAFDSKSGQSIWKVEQPSNHRDSYDSNLGPKSTPVIDSNKVYSYGVGGQLTCTDLETGKILWTHDAAKEFRSDKGFFGRCSSPMVANGLVLLNLGGQQDGKGAGVAAFDAKTGKMVWQATEHEASYASPIQANLNGKDTAIFFTREGLVGATLNEKNPKLLFDTYYRPAMHASVNAASAVHCGDNKIFASTCYGVGAATWEVTSDGKLKQLWKKQDLLDCHFATPVFYKGHLYGIHGRQESGTQIRCIDPNKGELLWTTRTMSPGLLLIADNKLVTLLESGELLIAEATTKGFKELARRQILGSGRSYPAISNSVLYARDNSNLVAIKLD